MNREMNRDRFEDLAEAHGGDVARWPQEAWEAAAALMAADPDFTSRVLARAAELDAALDAWAPVGVTHALREAVIAGAPAPRRAPVRAWFWRAGLGAGLAAACAAGLAVGVLISDVVVVQPDDAAVSTAFNGYDDLSDVVPGEGA